MVADQLFRIHMEIVLRIANNSLLLTLLKESRLTKSNNMKPKSHAAIVKTMKAYKKKTSNTPADAIVKKLKEIKKGSKKEPAREVQMALFRQLSC